MSENSHQPTNLPETAKDPFDEFSLDNLIQMDTNSPASAATPTLSTDSASMAEVDFDNLFNFDGTASTSAQEAKLYHVDIDSLDLNKVKLDKGIIEVPDSTQSIQLTLPNSDTLTPTIAPDFSAATLTTDASLPNTAAINPMAMVAGVGATGATIATTKTVKKPKSTVGGLFAKKYKVTSAKEKITKPKKQSVIKPVMTSTLNTAPKKNRLIPLLLGLLVIFGVTAWLFSQSITKAPKPKPVAVAPVAKPVPTPVAQPVSAVTTVTTTSATSAVLMPETMGVATSAPMTTSVTTPTEETSESTVSVIKPEEILATPIPNDPTLAKEALDKLADQSARLAEQEKMMEDQLKMTKALSDKKAERIALLEQQIAQLEAQKGQANP